MHFVSTNPCLCNSVVPTTCPTPCSSGAGCFCFCNIYVGPTDEAAVPPCGQTGTIDLLNYSHNTAVCGDTPVVLSVVEVDTDFFDATSLTASVLTWAIKAGVPTKMGTICVEAKCGERGKRFYVQIAKKDLCSSVNCLSSERCNECDGTCLPITTPAGPFDLTLKIE